jgi:hypothetical protein
MEPSNKRKKLKNKLMSFSSLDSPALDDAISQTAMDADVGAAGAIIPIHNNGQVSSS